jgi:hypothetical protein
MANNKLGKQCFVGPAEASFACCGRLVAATFEPAARQIHQNRQLPSKLLLTSNLFFRNGIPFRPKDFHRW